MNKSFTSLRLSTGRSLHASFVRLAITMTLAIASWGHEAAPAAEPLLDGHLLAEPVPAAQSVQGRERHPDQPCVLLRNGNVLFGTVTKIGPMASITRPDQSKISVPSDQVESVGGSVRDLYLFRLEHRFEGDLKRIQADVRWCLRYGLVREAAADVLQARSLDPSNPETQQLLRQIASRIKQDSVDPMVVANQDAPLGVLQVSHETAAPSDMAAESSDPDSDVSGLPERLVHAFAARIQPILMNRCAGCHAKDEHSDRPFQIHSALTSKWAPRVVVAENLRALMPYIDFDSPERSQIRIRATDFHGGRRHSFGDESSSMMVNLDYWLGQLTSVTDQSPWESALGDGETSDALIPAAPPELSSIDQASHETSPNGIPGLPVPIESARAWPAEPASADPLPRTRRMPKVENPFDPEIFNRRFHGH